MRASCVDRAAARCEGSMTGGERRTTMAGSLNVCHRQRGRVLRGQWLAVAGGRYHVLATTTWSGRR